MAEEARELAARGYHPSKIEAVLRFQGFLEAAEWIGQPYMHKQLKNIAERARRSDQIKWNALPPSKKKKYAGTTQAEIVWLNAGVIPNPAAQLLQLEQISGNPT